MRILFVISAMIILTICYPSYADSQWVGTFNIDNDLPYTDQNYTNGLRLKLGKIGVQLPYRMLSPDPIQSWHVVLGNMFYTPEAIDSTAIIDWDRPFADYTYISLLLSSFSPRYRQLLTVELSAGKIGTTLGGYLQERVHAQPWTTAPDPEGWRNQISEEFAGQLAITFHDQILRACEKNDHAVVDIWHNARVEVGNVFRRAKLGGILRVGRMNTLFQPDNIEAISLDYANNPVQPYEFELYAFTSVEGYYVCHNALIEGAARKSPHTLGARPWVAVWNAGLHTSCKGWFLEFSFAARSPEVANDLADPNGHQYFRLHVGYKGWLLPNDENTSHRPST